MMSSEISQITKKPSLSPVFDSDAGKEGIWHNFREIFAYRYMLQNLVVRDIKVRYKNSVLGILWSMLNPLGLMLVFTILFTVLSQNAQRQYPVFVLVGLLPWEFLSGALTGSTVSIISQGSLVKKVYFPRILLPTSAMLSNLVNFFIAFLVLVAFLYAYGIGLTIHALWLPAILLTQMIFLQGLGMILGAMAVFYRDVLMILNVVMRAWFFLTPVFYPLEQFGSSSTILGITFVPAQVMRWVNPMASIVDGYRTVLWGTVKSDGPASMDPIFLLRTFITSLIVLIIGYIIFDRTEYLFGEKL